MVFGKQKNVFYIFLQFVCKAYILSDSERDLRELFALLVCILSNWDSKLLAIHVLYCRYMVLGQQRMYIFFQILREALPVRNETSQPLCTRICHRRCWWRLTVESRAGCPQSPRQEHSLRLVRCHIHTGSAKDFNILVGLCWTEIF